jgi:uncharacterized Tic20 family protein
MAEEQMSRHPSEPPADWLSSAGEATARPAPGEALPQRPAPPAPRSGYPAGGHRGNGQGRNGQGRNGQGRGEHLFAPGSLPPPGYPQPPPGYPAMPDYPPTPDYPPAPGYPPGTGYLSAPEYPGYPPAYAAAGTAEPGYPGYPPAPGGEAGPAVDHDEYAATHGGYGPAREGYRPSENDLDPHGLVPSEYGVVYDDYGRPHGVPAGPPPDARAPFGPAAAGPGAAAAPRSGDSARWAMLAYLTVPLFGFAVPLVAYLRARRGPGWTRAHAAQALNVWITTASYGISAVIMGTMLALDSPQVALIVFGPVLAGLWLVALAFLVRAATAASRGQDYTFPRWLCSRVVR